MYAKLQNNKLQIAPSQVQFEGQTIINPNSDVLLTLGYLPVQFTGQPTVGNGYYSVHCWTQTETAIVQEWNVLKDTRPLTESEVTRLLIAQQINTLSVDDNTALRMLDFYPSWAAGTAYPAGHKVQHGGKLFRCVQAHTSQTGWEPSTATASLWEQICETHDGTLADPIPYDGSMALTSGLYYIQDSTIYLCTRDTVNPVYNPLADLVGIYVEQV